MKIAMRAGHSPNCRGSKAYVDEYDCNIDLYNRLVPVLEANGHTIVNCNSYESNQGEDLRKGTSIANSNGADVFISLHNNACPGGYGTEALVIKISDNIANNIANRVCENMSNLGFRNRGVKVRTGLHDLRVPSMPSVIIEGFFVDSKEDTDRFNALSWDEIVLAYANAIDPNINLIGNISKPTLPPTPPTQSTDSIFEKARRYNNARCKELQVKLNKCGFDCGIADDIYGIKTHNALGEAQSFFGLNVDYLAGEKTFAKLNERILQLNPPKPQGNDWVLRLQKELNKQGFRDKNGNRLNEDGIIGELTISAFPTIKYGSEGNITRLVQELLNSKGYSTNGIDGLFYNGSVTATKKYQGDRGLSQDGCFGKQSLRKAF